MTRRKIARLLRRYSKLKAFRHAALNSGSAGGVICCDRYLRTIKAKLKAEIAPSLWNIL